MRHPTPPVRLAAGIAGCSNEEPLAGAFVTIIAWYVRRAERGED